MVMTAFLVGSYKSDAQELLDLMGYNSFVDDFLNKASIDPIYSEPVKDLIRFILEDPSLVQWLNKMPNKESLYKALTIYAEAQVYEIYTHPGVLYELQHDKVVDQNGMIIERSDTVITAPIKPEDRFTNLLKLHLTYLVMNQYISKPSLTPQQFLDWCEAYLTNLSGTCGSIKAVHDVYQWYKMGLPKVEKYIQDKCNRLDETLLQPKLAEPSMPKPQTNSTIPQPQGSLILPEVGDITQMFNRQDIDLLQKIAILHRYVRNRYFIKGNPQEVADPYFIFYNASQKIIAVISPNDANNQQYVQLYSVNLQDLPTIPSGLFAGALVKTNLELKSDYPVVIVNNVPMVQQNGVWFNIQFRPVTSLVELRSDLVWNSDTAEVYQRRPDRVLVSTGSKLFIK